MVGARGFEPPTPWSRRGIGLQCRKGRAVGAVPFIGLLLISFAYIGVFLQALWLNSSELLPLMILGLPLGLLWLIWIHLSAMLRELLFGSRSRNMRR